MTFNKPLSNLRKEGKMSEEILELGGQRRRPDSLL